jgi:hypothetical protein
MGLRRSFKPKNIVPNGNFAKGTAGWYNNICTSSVANSELICAFTAADTTAGVYGNVLADAITGNKYYLIASIYPKYARNFLFGFADNYISALPMANVWNKFTGIVTLGNNRRPMLYHNVSANYTSGDTWKFSSFLAIDLTALFGAGNEPTVAWCDNNFPAWFDGTMSGGSMGGIGGLK